MPNKTISLTDEAYTIANKILKNEPRGTISEIVCKAFLEHAGVHVDIESLKEKNKKDIEAKRLLLKTIKEDDKKIKMYEEKESKEERKGKEKEREDKRETLNKIIAYLKFKDFKDEKERQLEAENCYNKLSKPISPKDYINFFKYKYPKRFKD